MSPRAIPAPAWFIAALIPMVASQIVRLHQHDPVSWICWDYAGRLGGLAMLAAIPSARAVAFRLARLRIALWEVALWIAIIVAVDHYLAGWARRTITVLGAYPNPSGWLYLVDVVFGIALVAYSEEIVFRRCARHLFQIYLGDGYALVIITSLLFGAYHSLCPTSSPSLPALKWVVFLLRGKRARTRGAAGRANRRRYGRIGSMKLSRADREDSSPCPLMTQSGEIWPDHALRGSG
jgi:uncharacterized protein